MATYEARLQHKTMCPRVMMLGFATVLLVMSCGDGSEANRAADAVPVDRDAFIEYWGNAMLRGDMSTIVDLVEPSGRDQALVDAAALAEKPRGVHVTDFGFKVVRENANSVEVVYSGEVCEQKLSKSFGPTTVAGEAGTGSSSSESDGVIGYGETECLSVKERTGSMSPFHFVKIDGHWYWDPPDN
ncbi:MAG: hypothetical protein WBA45_16025 [Microthrixaceae bacterium]